MPYLVTRDGTRLHYSSWGAGKPIVFVHGWAIPSDMWEYQLPSLIAAGYRCVVFDHRGCGRSEHACLGYELDTLAADLADLLQHLELSSMVLIGFSLGGGVIARYLATFGSDRVSHCVLIASSTPFLLKAPNNPDGIEPAAVYDGFLAGLAHDRPQLLAAVAPGFFGVGLPGNAISPEMMQWIVNLCLQSSARGMVELYKAVNVADLRGDMAAFRMATLVIHGDSDPFMPAQFTAERTASAIARSELKLYEHASHGLFITHREQLATDILSFLGSNG